MIWLPKLLVGIRERIQNIFTLQIFTSYKQRAQTTIGDENLDIRIAENSTRFRKRNFGTSGKANKIQGMSINPRSPAAGMQMATWTSENVVTSSRDCLSPPTEGIWLAFKKFYPRRNFGTSGRANTIQGMNLNHTKIQPLETVFRHQQRCR